MFAMRSLIFVLAFAPDTEKLQPCLSEGNTNHIDRVVAVFILVIALARGRQPRVTGLKERSFLSISIRVSEGCVEKGCTWQAHSQFYGDI